MIQRGILQRPGMVAAFDFANDYKDTREWLCYLLRLGDDCKAGECNHADDCQQAQARGERARVVLGQLVDGYTDYLFDGAGS